jgi:hypothetical protein
MNWNGRQLYKVLPVTLDFSKVLSKMAKQTELLDNIPYDFRFSKSIISEEQIFKILA